jgi:hypothetical protein
MMSSDPSFIPDIRDLPMPAGRAEVRRLAFRHEILATGADVRRSGVWWKVAVPLLAAGTLAGVLVVADRADTPRDTSPTASWTAIPQSLSEADSSAAALRCQSTLTSRHWPISVSAMTAVLAERRGHLTAVMLSGDGQYGMCIGSSNDPVFAGIGEVGVFDPASTVMLDGAPGALNGPAPFRLACGQVASSVGGVEIDTVDGRHIDATVTNGRFFAWWPSGADPRTITATASDGRVLKTVIPAPSNHSAAPVHQPGTP